MGRLIDRLTDETRAPQEELEAEVLQLLSNTYLRWRSEGKRPFSEASVGAEPSESQP
ncbi:MAG: hypothetical protein ABI867_41540 [Kofleriaceae bacterium]